MEPTIIIIVLTGALAGGLHVLTGPDHLAAIAPFSANQPKGSWLIGLWWGAGHTASIWLIGALMFLLREVLPLESLSHWSERLVGAVLIGLGIWGILKAMNSRVHYHTHEHDGVRHAHFHLHSNRAEPHGAQPSVHQGKLKIRPFGERAHQHTHAPVYYGPLKSSPSGEAAHHHTHAPLSIGMLHGLAGSSHFWGLLPALALPTIGESIGYIGGFGIGAIIAITAFSWALGKIIERFIRWSSDAYKWLQVGFSSVAIGVGLIWIFMV